MPVRLVPPSPESLRPRLLRFLDGSSTADAETWLLGHGLPWIDAVTFLETLVAEGTLEEDKVLVKSAIRTRHRLSPHRTC